MRISDWSSDVCSSDLVGQLGALEFGLALKRPLRGFLARREGARVANALHVHLDAIAGTVGLDARHGPIVWGNFGECTRANPGKSGQSREPGRDRQSTRLNSSH